MASLVAGTGHETGAIRGEVDAAAAVVARSAERFEAIVRDCGILSEDAAGIREAVETVALGNRQVQGQGQTVRSLVGDVAQRMDRSGSAVQELYGAAERIEELAARFRVGSGRFEAILDRVAAARADCAGQMTALAANGTDVFDRNYLASLRPAVRRGLAEAQDEARRLAGRLGRPAISASSSTSASSASISTTS